MKECLAFLQGQFGLGLIEVFPVCYALSVKVVYLGAGGGGVANAKAVLYY